MRRRNLYLLLIIFTFFTNINAQVTIGSLEAPRSGTLLDLQSTEKGLMLPRVSILNATVQSGKGLAQTIEGNPDTEDWDSTAHIGLLVYHTGKCTLDGEGMYVCTGTEWDKLGESSFGGVKLSNTKFNFLSGVDARGNANAESLTIEWKNNNIPTFSINPSDNPIEFKTPPIAPSGNSPYVMSLNYEPMPAKKVWQTTSGSWLESDPWHLTRTSTLEFADPICGNELGKAVVEMSQTNYALWVNGRSSSFSYPVTAKTDAVKIPVKGNVEWKTTILHNDLLTEDVVGQVVPKEGGTTIDVITAAEKNNIDQNEVNIDLTNFIESTYGSLTILFSDKQTPKRFEDITMTAIGCFNRKNTNDGTIKDWAIRAGFTEEEISAVTVDQPSKILSNSLQLHKDQSGNLFLSSDFGSAGRWMVTNLAATQYAPKPRTGDDKELYKSTYLTRNRGESNFEPWFCYPATTKNGQDYASSLYNNNQRLGLLYNWSAATNGKSVWDQVGDPTGVRKNSSGTYQYPNDVEKKDNPNIDPQQGKIQGICPNGWHLPSDREYTWLEQEVLDHASVYTNDVDQNLKIELGVYTEIDNWYPEKSTFRGRHSAYMRDLCPDPQYTNTSKFTGAGISNPFHVKDDGERVGFNMMIAGYNRSFSMSPTDQDVTYSWTGFLWTSSGAEGSSSSRSAISRLANIGGQSEGDFQRTSGSRYSAYSVRCKKD